MILFSTDYRSEVTVLALITAGTCTILYELFILKKQCNNIIKTLYNLQQSQKSIHKKLLILRESNLILEEVIQKLNKIDK